MGSTGLQQGGCAWSWAGPGLHSAPECTYTNGVPLCTWCCAEVGRETSQSALEGTLPGRINAGQTEEAGIVKYKKNAEIKGGK